MAGHHQVIFQAARQHAAEFPKLSLLRAARRQPANLRQGLGLAGHFWARSSKLSAPLSAGGLIPQARDSGPPISKISPWDPPPRLDVLRSPRLPPEGAPRLQRVM